VAQAATGQLAVERAPLEGTTTTSKLQQVGFLNSYGSSCGPVCDCGSCGGEEILLEEPGCGIEVGCGVEPGCGIEVGCGIGHAMEMLGPSQTCGDCGGMGCSGCCEAVCGVEEFCVDGPACGMEEIGDCSCDDCCQDEVGGMPLCLPYFRVNWARFEFFAGVQGFKGPLNFARISASNANLRSGSGSFGFYEGFNEGRSLQRLFGCDIAAQLGIRATQSNLSGAEFTPETRHQVFVTGGLFRRVDYGLQYGVVLDYLNQDWYFQGDSIQLRGELSWRFDACHVGGFQWMTGLDSDTSRTVVDDGSGTGLTSTISFEPTTQYRFFYRRMLAGNGEWNAFGGWTDRDDGIIGADMSLPLRRRLALNTGATYLIPREGSRSGGNQEEGWNVALGLTYRLGGPSGCGRYCRPMFDVADNGSFMIDFR
jgi:hypothetical protein